MRIAIQGQQYSFHDVAQQQFFGTQSKVVPCNSFKDVFFALSEGEVDAAVVAMENSLYGSINEVYDLVLKDQIWIGGEVYLHISHNLLGVPGSTIEAIEEVHSHPIALAQCEQYLDTKLQQVERFEHHDTAGSAADIKTWSDTKKAAIASKQAAEAYGLKILEEQIETNPHNYTRFVVVYKEETPDNTADKTSLILNTGHKPGALYKALGAFAKNDINLSKLESRPIIGTRWQYMFYVDVEAGQTDPRLKNALDALTSNEQKYHILGSYKRGVLPPV